MFKRRFWPLVAILVVLGTLAYWRFPQKNIETHENPILQTNTNPILVTNSASSTSSPLFRATNAFEESAVSLSHLMDKYSRDEAANSEALLRDLEALGLQAFKVTDGVPDSSELTIVRTQNSLPGTRYFHAQFFKDEKGGEFLQHMSFELKPSEQVFKKATQIAQAYLNHKVNKEHSENDMHIWKMTNGRNVYVKRMSLEDLKDHPFNAYTPGDVGTVRVVHEKEIHDDAN